ncbi:MAG: Uncharacterized protein Greene071421_274 [Parcubacteria group bacterium Greene0714_21]|nr:MAG: Uncharacterized protein Greene041639_261 [Parcubacteria group bacterium Greene0416_39]TSC97600.1 MAG: Uncharacterized protein Greene101447_410 [Parcubacteria group bacterium Greene1014_47]TSD04438.1 MAG: Uncharacterized protein Greene071421_274 [Parcubacteria group bacterium Greene0714_21]
MRKPILLFGIALSVFFVLSQEGDRSFDSLGTESSGRTSESLRLEETQDHVLPQNQALRQNLGQALLNTTLGFPDAKYEVFVPVGSTVYDLMDKASKQYGFSFSGESFPGMGFFVEEIKGVRQNPGKGLYWIYYINGEKSQVGVSSYILKPYDVISWKYGDEE